MYTISCFLNHIYVHMNNDIRTTVFLFWSQFNRSTAHCSHLERQCSRLFRIVFRVSFVLNNGTSMCSL